MIVLGPKGVAIIYVCTIIALVIGFGLGRIIPAKLLISFCLSGYISNTQQIC